MATIAHGHEPDYGTGKKTLAVYVTGLVLCIILTLIPFAAVMSGKLSHSMTYAILLISALAQFFVQVICFLRLNTATQQGMINVLSFVFAIVVLMVVVGGSLWIMWHLNYNMMH